MPALATSVTRQIFLAPIWKACAPPARFRWEPHNRYIVLICMIMRICIVIIYYIMLYYIILYYIVLYYVYIHIYIYIYLCICIYIIIHISGRPACPRGSRWRGSSTAPRSAPRRPACRPSAASCIYIYIYICIERERYLDMNVYITAYIYIYIY